ncbi:MAG: WbqC family protein [Candidatus Omnitrophica bacterium]|nr:WbqC family protein [Candidatus Omnitrophota bacterium]
MIIAAHQPQYLPWLGYFHKIYEAQAFVFLDNVQYEERGYQNRNRIRTKDSWIWLSVPVLKTEQPYPNISQVYIDNSQDWNKRHWRSIYLNYTRSAFFKEYSGFFEDLYSKKWERLIDLNIHLIKSINQFLGIDKKIYLESQFKINSASTQRIIDICQALKADVYLSGAGGKAYLEEEKFQQNNIKLIYQQFKHPEYTQLHKPFLPFMSIIDLMFNHGPDSLKILSGT